MLYRHCRGCHGFWSVPHLQNKYAGFAKHLPEVWHCLTVSLEVWASVLSRILHHWSGSPPPLTVKKKHNTQHPLRQSSSMTTYTPTRNWSRHGEGTMATYRALWSSTSYSWSSLHLQILGSLKLFSSALLLPAPEGKRVGQKPHNRN